MTFWWSAAFAGVIDRHARGVCGGGREVGLLDTARRGFSPPSCIAVLLRAAVIGGK